MGLPWGLEGGQAVRGATRGARGRGRGATPRVTAASGAHNDMTRKFSSATVSATFRPQGPHAWPVMQRKTHAWIHMGCTARGLHGLSGAHANEKKMRVQGECIPKTMAGGKAKCSSVQLPR